MLTAILKYSIGSLFYGGLITVLLLSLFIFLIKGWYKDAVFRPVSFVVLGILALIVLWNSTIICGALAMKSDIISIRTMLETTVESLGLDLDSVADTMLSSEIFQDVIASHPILGYYADYCEFSGWTLAELPAAMCGTLTDYLDGIILRRLLWSIGFVILAAVIVIKTMDRPSRARAAAGAYSRGSARMSRTPRPAGRASSRHAARR